MHTDLDYHHVILVDDASPDPVIAQLIAELAELGGVTCLNTGTNQGFVGAVNMGLEAAEGDVVILNSDTVVTANWLEKLQRAAYARPDVGTVTPLSNHASICSIPEPMRYNQLPEGFSVDGFAALVDRISPRNYPEIPAGIGFCLYVRRVVLDAVGGLDGLFERGYAEDTDLCLRARRAGYRNLMDDATFIYHSGGKSFESNPDPAVLEAKNRMIQRNLRRLAERYPDYQDEVQRTLEGPLRFFHDYLRVCLKTAQQEG